MGDAPVFGDPTLADRELAARVARGIRDLLRARRLDAAERLAEAIAAVEPGSSTFEADVSAHLEASARLDRAEPRSFAREALALVYLVALTAAILHAVSGSAPRPPGPAPRGSMVPAESGREAR